MNKMIRVLVVDDSAFVRKTVREMLARCAFVEVVGAARDGVEALEMVERLKPDVVTCDLNMPRLDGVGFIRQQMAKWPVPILLISVTQEESERALQGLEAGAVDFIQKPTALATNDLLRIQEELIEKVKAAARVPAERLVPETEQAPEVPLRPRPLLKVKMVVIGISTGGPQALRHLIPQFPKDFPVPVAMVLHMPIGYTALFAQKLNEISKLNVEEAVQGDVIEPGRAILAPAGRHLSIKREPTGRVVGQLSVHPLDALHRPCADVLFQSAAQVYGDGVLGVVMTGMGKDGQQGAAWIKAQGGTVLTEAEESCVIYGMPRSVVEAGLSDAAIPLGKMAAAIMDRL
jgi:two-component system chemotaxis response regulator CheB